MEPIYVTGHRNPDTDSIVSAMAYAALRNALGDREYVAARLGQLSDETQAVLDRFGMSPPQRIHNVRTQVRDLKFDTPPILSGAVTVSHAWSTFQSDDRILGMPVADEEGGLLGMLTPSDIAAFDMRSIERPVAEEIPVFNLLSALEARILNQDGGSVDQVSGEVILALPQSRPELGAPKPGSIVLCGHQPELAERALEAGASCLILCQTELSEQLRDRQTDTLILATPFDAYRAARMIYQSVPIERVCRKTGLVRFHLDDYLDDVRETILQSRYRSYPILDENEKVVGTLSRFHLIRPGKKRVVLVDHNETSQSVPGLEQAEILEILDHHRLADVQTLSPIFFRNEPVGSTATIIASMYQEKGLMPSPKLAGLLCAAILSDTILFKSPTCVEKDQRMAERRARIAGLDLEELGYSIFSASAVDEKPAEELLGLDFKEFHIAGHNIGIGQVTCLDSQKVLRRLPDFLKAMEKSQAQHRYNMLLLMLTDVLREGTELLILGDEDVVRQAFNVEVNDHHAFLPGVVSRKKQVVPMLSLLWG